MAGFLNELMDQRIAYGFQGGPVYQNQRIIKPGGGVYRKILLDTPVYRYTLSYNAVSVDGSHLKLVDYSAILALFHRTRGVKSFRFRDRFDYQVTNELIGTGDGATSTFQMIKTYGTIDGEEMVRTITKPVTSAEIFGYSNRTPITVLINDVEDATATVNATTGIVTPTSTPALNDTVKVTGHFDVPVMFDHDDFMTDYHNFLLGAAQLSLMEDINA